MLKTVLLCVGKKILSSYLLYAKNLKVQFDKVVALDDVDFYIEKNEIVGLLGDNGAGKSTLIKSLIGLYKLQSGVLYINGFKVLMDNIKLQSEAGDEYLVHFTFASDDKSIVNTITLIREV